MSRKQLRKAVGKLDIRKQTRIQEIPGILGLTIGGIDRVEVPGRDGYVYVRLRDNLSEVMQAFNDTVAPVFGLPVVVSRDEVDKSRYRVKGRDIGRYQSWGTVSSYLPRHGGTHSFNPEAGGGGDVVWIYDRQIIHFQIHPSGSVGSRNVVIEPGVYYWNDQFKHAGGTGTGDLVSLNPTVTATAKMVLVYLDDNSNPALLEGGAFPHDITGMAGVTPYIPTLSSTVGVPVGAVRLVTGTSSVLWENIYDVRPFGVISPQPLHQDSSPVFINLTVHGNITVDDGSWIGISGSSPRIEFDDTNSYINIVGMSRLGVGTSFPTGTFHAVGNENDLFTLHARGAGLAGPHIHLIWDDTVVTEKSTISYINTGFGASYRHGAIEYRAVTRHNFYVPSDSVALSNLRTTVMLSGTGIGIETPEERLDVAGGICITDGIPTPLTHSGKATIFVDLADGDLKVRFGDGTVKTIVADT